MLINNNGINPNTGTNAKHKAIEDTPTSTVKNNASSPGSKDNVALSKEGQLLSQLENKISVASDVDTSKVDRIRQSIEDGTYTIDANSIADKLLKADKAY